MCSLFCFLCSLFAGTKSRRLGIRGTKSPGLRKFLMEGGILNVEKASTCNIRAWIEMMAEMVGFLGANTAFDLLYIFAVELFPTTVRSVAVSMLRMSIMIGAAVAPVVVVLGRITSSLSFLVFGGLAILSGLLTLCLPETRNRPLYETLMEQQDKHQIAAAPEPPPAVV